MLKKLGHFLLPFLPRTFELTDCPKGHKFGGSFGSKMAQVNNAAAIDCSVFNFLNKGVHKHVFTVTFHQFE